MKLSQVFFKLDALFCALYGQTDGQNDGIGEVFTTINLISKMKMDAYTL